jgi:hypothetical protein
VRTLTFSRFFTAATRRRAPVVSESRFALSVGRVLSCLIVLGLSVPASAEPILIVSSTATMTSGDPSNAWRYTYTLTNASTCAPGTSPCQTEALVEFVAPIFSLTDVDPASIVFTREDSFHFFGGGFLYDASRDATLAANPGIYGPNPSAFEGITTGIDWRFFRTPLLVGESMELTFNSAYAPTSAPYFAVWSLGPPPSLFSETNGGAILMPNSPAYQATQSIPEPSTLLLLAPAALAFLRRRSRPNGP